MYNNFNNQKKKYILDIVIFIINNIYNKIEEKKLVFLKYNKKQNYENFFNIGDIEFNTLKINNDYFNLYDKSIFKYKCKYILYKLIINFS